MLGTSNFTKSLIMFIFTLLLIANILYAFNINSVIGGSLSGIDVNADLSNSYFGISTFMDNWEAVYSNNSALQSLSDLLKGISNAMQKVNLVELVRTNFEGSKASLDILVALTSIVNTLFNIAWILETLLYTFFLGIYLIFVVFSFLSFILTFISGFAYTELPSTQFPDIQPLFTYVLNFI